MFSGLSKKDRSYLLTEVISDEARLKLTRLIRNACIRNAYGEPVDSGTWIGRANKFINVANNVMGRPVYLLEADDWGEYHLAEGHWHSSRLEIIMREPTTIQLANILGDYVENGLLEASEVDRVLKDENISFSIEGDRLKGATIRILPINEIEEGPEDPHPNIRLLVSRMDRSLEEKDYSAVLHAAASIHETLAKLVMPERKYQGKTLGEMLRDYRSRSSLPQQLINYIDQIYVDRGRVPLAGHGSAKVPTVTPEEAVVLCEITKALVRVERSLAPRQASLGVSTDPSLEQSSKADAGASTPETTGALVKSAIVPVVPPSTPK